METKLHGWHARAGARMADFGGWDMPIQYEGGPREEHLRVRGAAGLFDIDHMGRFEISGAGALDFLQGIQTWDASRIAPGRAHYSMLCSESGGILDDIFLYRLSRSTNPREYRGAWLMVVNASNRSKDWEWLASHARGFDLVLRDRSDDTCMVALQGPAARAILEPLCTGADLAGFGHRRVAEVAIAGAATLLCSTGYTGEPGYEMLLPAEGCEPLWSEILAAGAAAGLIPCGLAARDSLRAEACLPLYGHEIDESIDPFSAGLARAAVCMEGHDFVGRQALTEVSRAPLIRCLAGFEMIQPGVPRHGYAITKDGQAVGRVTTGLFSPSTGRYLAMGWIEAECAKVGTQVDIVIRDFRKAARVVERPFYTSPHWR